MADSKGNERYNTFLNCASVLFRKHGIRRVTVEEVCREAGVSKMTFYRMFRNKNELAEKVLVRDMEGHMLKYRNIMKQEISFVEKIKKVIDLKHQESQNLSQEFIRDIYQLPEPGIQLKMEEYSKKALDEFMRDLKKAQKRGLIKNKLKPELIIYMIQTLTDLIQDEKLLNMYNNTQEAVMEATNFFFYGIMDQEAG
jgi:AcrR family transcriptional regulator